MASLRLSEPGPVDLLAAGGVDGQFLQRHRIVQTGIQLRFDDQRHRVPLADLPSGQTLTLHDHPELVQDLIRARLAARGQVEFDAEAVAIDGWSLADGRVVDKLDDRP